MRWRHWIQAEKDGLGSPQRGQLCLWGAIPRIITALVWTSSLSPGGCLVKARDVQLLGLHWPCRWSLGVLGLSQGSCRWPKVLSPSSVFTWSWGPHQFLPILGAGLFPESFTNYLQSRQTMCSQSCHLRWWANHLNKPVIHFWKRQNQLAYADNWCRQSGLFKQRMMSSLS